MTGQLKAKAMTLWSFWTARRRMKRIKTREMLQTFQAQRLERFLDGPAAMVDALKTYKGKPLSDWPISDKQTLMEDFHRYNRLGLSAEDGWAHFDAGTAPKGYAIGASTGTSGNRGLYVVSERERYRWLGVILSRALPDILQRSHRVAVVLPANSRLYDAANESGRLKLEFFDLADGIEAQFDRLVRFQPSVIVAPPKLLAALADADVQIRPERVFSGAEVLDPLDRAQIEAHFGVIVREIYMATEGLFGVACEHGRLHLIEDHITFEWERVEGENHLVTPLITDFSRETQIMVRYRMNDLLELSDEPCPCGAVGQTVKAVHGRCDDVFSFEAGAGRTVRVTPDVIRNAVLGADRGIGDFRVVLTAPNSVELVLDASASELLAPACRDLYQLFQRCGAPHVEILARAEHLKPPSGRKLRRVMVQKGALPE